MGANETEHLNCSRSSFIRAPCFAQGKACIYHGIKFLALENGTMVHRNGAVKCIHIAYVKFACWCQLKKWREGGNNISCRSVKKGPMLTCIGHLHIENSFLLNQFILFTSITILIKAAFTAISGGKCTQYNTTEPHNR